MYMESNIRRAMPLQLLDMAEMMSGWEGFFAVALNSEWDDNQEDSANRLLISSWQSVYCFRPMEIQARF